MDTIYNHAMKKSLVVMMIVDKTVSTVVLSTENDFGANMSGNTNNQKQLRFNYSYTNR